MSRYSVVYLPRGEATELNAKLVKEVGPKFGENYVIEHPRPPHITLKSPFEIADSTKLEETIKEFVKTQKAADVSIEGFDNFRRFVAFMKVNFDENAMNIQKNLLKELLKLDEIYPKDTDLAFNPHFTVAYGNTEESFDGIWEYLQLLPPFKFNLKLDNITILKKVNDLWEVYKTFEIK